MQSRNTFEVQCHMSDKNAQHGITYDVRAKKSSTASDASPCETALSGSGMYREVEETFVSICNSPLLLSTERTAPCAFNHSSHSYNPSALLASQTSSIAMNPKTCAAYFTGKVGRYDLDMHFIASKRIRST